MHRIGVLTSSKVKGSGGGFQYIMTLIEALKEMADVEVVVFYDDPSFRDYSFESPRFQWVLLDQGESHVTKSIRAVSAFLGARSPVLGRYSAILEYGIELLITYHSFIGFHLGIPFVGFIGDVMYKHYPRLPEYPWTHRWHRDLTTRMLTKHAEITVVDSEESKKDLIKFFGVTAHKVRPIHLCAPPHIYRQSQEDGDRSAPLTERHRLPPRYIFYPAQFWSHKNHANLVRALHLIQQKHGIVIPAVFVGSACESYQSVLALIAELGMGEQVRCLGYLTEEEVVELYRGATALVFPSFADYTAIPLVEAMVLGTPVVSSNVFSIPEQVGRAGVFFNPFAPEDIAEAIYRVWTDEALRVRLIANGRKRGHELSPGEFRKQWRVLVDEALSKHHRDL